MGFGKQHRIWVDVYTDADYVTSKDFGGEEYIELKVNVGYSKAKSVQPVTIQIKRKGDFDINVKVVKNDSKNIP